MKKEHPLPELLAELKDFLALGLPGTAVTTRSEEHTSELQSP